MSRLQNALAHDTASYGLSSHALATPFPRGRARLRQCPTLRASRPPVPPWEHDARFTTNRGEPQRGRVTLRRTISWHRIAAGDRVCFGATSVQVGSLRKVYLQVVLF